MFTYHIEGHSHFGFIFVPLRLVSIFLNVVCTACLWALANTFFYDVTIKLYYSQKWLYFKLNFRENNLHQQKARKKLNIRHLNGHPYFSNSK